MPADDLFKRPDDGLRYELIEGELRSVALAASQHGRVAMNVASDAGEHVKTNDLGVVFATGTGFKIRANPDTVRAADAAFVTELRADAIGDPLGYWPGAPDLAIEVLSPSDNYAEVEEKVFDWLDAGARLVIVFNPRKKTATAYRSRTSIRVHTATETIDASDVASGWIFQVSRAFD